MPYKASLTKAIKDEGTDFLRRRILLVLGPGAVLLSLAGFSGWVAVRVLKAPDLFDGLIPEIMGYGILAIAALSMLTKGHVVRVWLNAWLGLHARYQARVIKLEAVLASLDADGNLPEPPAPPAPKPWTATPPKPRAERTGPILPSEQLKRAKENTGNLS